jgi:hypothetical protein
MRIESLREVKTKPSKIVKKLPSERSVVITKRAGGQGVMFGASTTRSNHDHAAFYRLGKGSAPAILL